VIVADASFTGAWLLPDERSTAADMILKQIVNKREELAVPELWNYEMMNLLLVAFRRNRIQESHMVLGIRLVQSLPCTFYDHHTALSKNRTHTFAQRFALSAYDACYLELADRLQCKLYSLDNVLVKAAQKLGLS